jgi:cell division protein ZapA
MSGMPKSIRVTLLGREYTLRVKEENESLTRELAQYVDAKLRAFKDAHPEQSETTAAIITALAITEELFVERTGASNGDSATLDQEFDDLERLLAEALTDRA